MTCSSNRRPLIVCVLTAQDTQGAHLPNGPATLLGRDADSLFADATNADLTAQLLLHDGTTIAVANSFALRPNRGTWEATEIDGAVRLRSNRNEPVGDLQNEGLMIQEGAWRFSELVLAPIERTDTAARLDEPIFGHADWRLYDAVYGTGAMASR